jgi:ribose-phosphate pyrophosphokinase
LFIPYIPSSRQDRVKGNEAATLEVYTTILKSLVKAVSITYLDPHSIATSTMLGTKAIELPTKIAHSWQHLKNFTFVSPDLGAVSRVRKHAGNEPILIADKVRDYTTGEITEIRLLNPDDVYETEQFIVIDDICDGGRTFIELAKVIRNQFGIHVNMHLIVTHGFFTKGVEHLYSSGYTSVNWVNDMQSKELQ